MFINKYTEYSLHVSNNNSCYQFDWCGEKKLILIINIDQKVANIVDEKQKAINILRDFKAVVITQEKKLHNT